MQWWCRLRRTHFVRSSIACISEILPRVCHHVLSCIGVRATSDQRVSSKSFRTLQRAVPGPVDCVLGSDFTAWSECAGACGETGTRTRTRSGDAPALHGGTECIPATESQACAMPACARSFALSVMIFERSSARSAALAVVVSIAANAFRTEQHCLYF